MATRAHDDLAKLARRMDILQAARVLFLQDPHQLPSAARIAQEAGLAKGTVYLYFRTKEEIFLALLGEEFLGVLTEISTIFNDAIERAQQLDLAQFIGRYVSYLQSHPEFLRLDAMSYSVLEQNMDADKLREFKLGLVHAVTQTGGLLDAALRLPDGSGTQLLLRMYAITRGLWQSLDYPPALQEIMAEEVFAPIRPAFESELVLTLTAFWRGVLAGN
jgi:AcrR family transcriptional regulator